MEHQAPRISYTFSHKGIIIDNSNSYHPEKIDITVTKTIDYIEGETIEQANTRLGKMDELTALLMANVENEVAYKAQIIRNALK